MSLFDNLISYWKLDEASGDAIDAQGLNDLTEHAGPTSSVAGKIGNAKFFNGDGWYECSSNGSLQVGPTVNWTIASWFKRALLHDGIHSYGHIAHKGVSESDYEWILRWGFQVGADPYIVFEVGQTTETAVRITPESEDEDWHLVIAWRDGNTIYLQMDNGTPASETIISSQVPTGTAKFSLGGLDSASMEGYLDEVGLWGRALTADERETLWNGGEGFSVDSFGSVILRPVVQISAALGLSVTGGATLTLASFPVESQPQYISAGNANVVHLVVLPVQVNCIAPQLVANVTLAPTCTIFDLDPPHGYWGYDAIINHRLQVSEGIALATAPAVIDTTLDSGFHSLDIQSFPTAIIFSVDHTLQLLTPEYLGSGVQTSEDVNLNETLKLIDSPRFTSTTCLYGTELAGNGVQSISAALTHAYPVTVTAHSATKYLESSRSGVGVVLFGVDNDIFKLNPSLTAFRRNGPQHVLHLAEAKPEVHTLLANFRLVTPFGDFAIGEFLYESPGGYLRIRNQSTIFASLLPADISSDAISIDPITVGDADTPGAILLDLHQPRVLTG